MSARLVLGPLLRYAGEREATVWVETDAPCEVEVLDRRERTFQVAGHHYAILALTDLEPGSATEYEVALDGERRWPDPSVGDFPPSAIRTIHPGRSLNVAFGSCRVSAPNEAPYTGRSRRPTSTARGVDALRALSTRMMAEPRENWPDLLLMLGDQIYADEVSPETRAFIRSRRDVSEPPGEQAADFEEYTRLYREAWSEPAFRWLVSTVPTAMVFDDHDVHDDWNTSRAWLEEMRAKPWWNERIVSAFMTYWLYQHLGNMPPAELAEDDVLRRVREADDAEPLLREFAYRADREPDSVRWSFSRDLGDTRLVVVDTRAARSLDEGARSMLDEGEWRWLDGQLRGGVDHLLIASSLPLFMTPGVHWVEAACEAASGGGAGRAVARVGEAVRQAVDLEHWPAFLESFERLVEMIRSVGAGERGEPPTTITTLGGDVHFAYLAEVAFPPEAGVRSAVHQAVCSPFRNPLGPVERTLMRLAASQRMGGAVRALARRGGVSDPVPSWSIVDGPRFDNQVATLGVDGGLVNLRLEHTRPAEEGLHLSFERRLS